MAFSSINFQKTNISKSGYCFQLYHNAHIRPNYAIGGEIIYDNSAEEAEKKRDEIIINAKKSYVENCRARNKKFQAKSYLWSAVVNIESKHTLKDLENLANYFRKEYGFQCYQIAMHKDEGYIDDNGNKQLNNHAHLEFVTLDENTGKNRWKSINRIALTQIQDSVAKQLGMVRGAYAEITKAKHLSGRAYAAIKEREKAEQKKRESEIEKKHKIEKKELQDLKNIFNAAFNSLDKEFETDYELDIPKATKNYITKFKKLKGENEKLKENLEYRCTEIAILAEKNAELESDIEQQREDFIEQTKQLVAERDEQWQDIIHKAIPKEFLDMSKRENFNPTLQKFCEVWRTLFDFWQRNIEKQRGKSCENQKYSKIQSTTHKKR